MDKEDIALRSEKARNIIGQIPSRIVHMGITVIFIVVLFLLSSAYFVKFDHTIKTKTKLYNENNEVHYTIELPYNKLKFLNIGQKLVIILQNERRFTTTVQDIDTTMHINREQSYFLVQGTFDHAVFKLDEPIEGQVTVYVGKTNLIDYVLNNN